MSIHVLSWVLRNSEAEKAARLVLIVLAEFAHDDGSKAFPDVETLMRRTRLSRRGVQGALRKLEEDGMIRNAGKVRSGTNVYSVVMGGAENARGAESDAAGAQNSTPGGARSAPNPSVDPSGEPSDTSSKGSPREPVQFSEWLGHHHEITGSVVPRAGTRARQKVAGMFAARQQDGLTLDELKAATLGAWHDGWRRENGHVGHVSVLRPEKCHELVSKGRRWQAQQAAAENDVTRSRTRWEDFDA